MLSCVLFIVHFIPENEVLGTVYFFNGKTERYVTVDFNHIKQLNDCTDLLLAFRICHHHLLST